MAVDQDLIDRALRIVVDQTPQRITGAVDWRLAKLVERFRGVPPQLSYVVLQSRHENERRMIDAVWSRLLTDQVLVLALPTETLRVGRDVPARHRQWPYFPPDLRDLDAATGEADAEIKAALIDVARHVDSLDRTAGAGRGSAARDWRRWDERMNWILTLLRSRQQDDTLFWKPFSPRDSRRIVEGELPLGAGDPTGRVQPPIGLGVFPDRRSATEQQVMRTIVPNIVLDLLRTMGDVDAGPAGARTDPSTLQTVREAVCASRRSRRGAGNQASVGRRRRSLSTSTSSPRHNACSPPTKPRSPGRCCMVALPQSYATEFGAGVLGANARLDSDLVRRIRRTAQFLAVVMQPADNDEHQHQPVGLDLPAAQGRPTSLAVVHHPAQLPQRRPARS